VTVRQAIGGLVVLLGIEFFIILANVQFLEKYGFWLGLFIVHVLLAIILAIIGMIVLGVNMLVGDK